MLRELYSQGRHYYKDVTPPALQAYQIALSIDPKIRQNIDFKTQIQE